MFKIFCIIFLLIFPIALGIVIARPVIRIKYNISEWAWIWVDTCVYMFSLLCMLSCTLALQLLNDVYEPTSIREMILFGLLQQGEVFYWL